MDHVAIDLGGRESQICVRNSDGKIISERRVPTVSLARYLEKQPTSRVIVETCAEAFSVADAALACGHQVRVVPAALVRQLGVGERRTKTDQRDARKLSEVSCRIDLPSVHVPSTQSRERKSLCGMREALVSSRTKLINTVRGWMRAQHLRFRGGGSTTFVARVGEQLAARRQAVPTYVERQLTMIGDLTVQIADADRELLRLAREDALCCRLMTVPGVGSVTAVRFAAALDEIGRFPHAHAVEAYLGLTPGEHSSSDKQRRTSITKAGPTQLRWALVQAAWSARRCRAQDPMVAWSIKIEQRRGRRIAIMALVRKLAGILYAIWRDGTTYQRERGAVSPTESANSMEMEATVPLLGRHDR